MLKRVAATLLMAVCAAVPAAEKPLPPDRKVEAAISTERVKKWVADLDSERFYDREVATEKLIDAGAVAVGPVAEAAASNNLEVTTRGMYILQELALSVDADTEEAAHGALKKLAESRGTATGRRAAATLAKLNAIRHDRALEELKRLGATVGTVSTQFGLPVVQRRLIEIGEKWRGEDKDLTRLGWLRDVDELMIHGPRVNDEWLKHVPKVTGLDTLTIKRAEVTDAGIRHLAGMKELRTLALMYLPITDESLQTLKEFQDFEKIKIYGCQITSTGADKLDEAFTVTEVDYRRGAFLGVACLEDHPQCVIYKVTLNGAAQKVGLMPKDVIYEYEGERVGNFESLTALIAKNVPGDKVTMKILRNEQKLTKTITLGEWE